MARAHSFAEHVLVDHKIIQHKPASLTFAQAAAYPLVLCTVWPIYADTFHISQRKGEWIYIHSGSSGVGSIAIALAKAAGLRVISSAGRADSREWAKKMGAEHVLDYTQDLAAQLKALQLEPVKMMLNAYTDVALPQILPLLAPGGTVVSVNYARDPTTGAPHGLSGEVVGALFMKAATLKYACDWAPPAAQIMADLNKLVESKAVPPISGSSDEHNFTGFDGILQAMDFQLKGKAIGKCTVTLDA